MNYADWRKSMVGFLAGDALYVDSTQSNQFDRILEAVARKVGAPTEGPTAPAPSDPLQSLIGAADAGDVDAQFKLGIIHDPWSKLGHDARSELGTPSLEIPSTNIEPHTPTDEEPSQPSNNHAETPTPSSQAHATTSPFKTDPATAEKYYLLAARQNHRIAIYNLARLYEYSHPPSPHLALHYYTLSATSQNDPIAQYHLGSLHEQGKLVPQSLPEAVKWYRLAVEQEQGAACWKLGRMYERGCVEAGVEVDLEEAERLYGVAMRKGFLRGRDALRRLKRRGGRARSAGKVVGHGSQAHVGHSEVEE
ncbi:hypothetical protein HDV00_000596 [Rhizophlyctis rosea]|nr:hypothetical protein HDV00_000596 [Rhizophlyctis rosea]